jgi:chitinase
MLYRWISYDKFKKIANGDKSKGLDVHSCVQAWLNAGTPKEKLIVGMATYGRSFSIVPTSNSGVNTGATGAGTAGPWTKEKGYLGYYEVRTSEVIFDFFNGFYFG